MFTFFLKKNLAAFTLAQVTSNAPHHFHEVCPNQVIMVLRIVSEIKIQVARGFELNLGNHSKSMPCTRVLIRCTHTRAPVVCTHSCVYLSSGLVPRYSVVYTAVYTIVHRCTYCSTKFRFTAVSYVIATAVS